MSSEAIGSITGSLVGMGFGALGAALISPSSKSLAPLSAESVGVTQAKAEALGALRKWNANRQVSMGLGAVLGASMGAYLGAPPQHRASAAAGAAVGVGLLRGLSWIRGQTLEFPGVLAGAAGAWVGLEVGKRM